MSVINRTGTPLLEGLPTTTTLTVGTTPTIVILPRTDGASAVIVKLVNMSAANTVAWRLVAAGATAPSAAEMTATGAVTDGSIMLTSDKEWLGLNTLGRDLYVVASAAATPVNVTVANFVGG